MEIAAVLASPTEREVAVSAYVAAVTTGAPHVDLLDPGFYQDLERMHAAFTWLRANDPVHHDTDSGVWGITRHADILDVERRDADFTSDGAYRARQSQGEDNMIAQDNPRHLEQRRLVVPYLVPAGVRRLEPVIRATVDELVDAMHEKAAAGEAIDVVNDVAAQLPARLTCHLLGFPVDRWRDMKSWSERLMRIDEVGKDADITKQFWDVLGEFGGALNTAIEERRGCPANDLIGVWANAELQDGPLPPSALFNETGLFISGGSETTRTVIARGLAAFCDHLDQWEYVAADPGRVPAAVEELLRWVTPLNNMFRTAVRDTRVGGTEVPTGARVALLYPSGNRDESVFEEPFRFDVTRHPNPQVAFGFGTHFCVGANLARAELRMLFEALTSRLTNLRVAEAPDIEANIFAGAVRSFTLRADPR